VWLKKHLSARERLVNSLPQKIQELCEFGDVELFETLFDIKSGGLVVECIVDADCKNELIGAMGGQGAEAGIRWMNTELCTLELLWPYKEGWGINLSGGLDKASKVAEGA
jgi:hypothetical protein